MKKIIWMVIAAVATSVTLPMTVCAETSTDVLMWYLDLSESEHDATAKNTTFDTINFYMVKSDDMNRTPVQNLNSRTYSSVGDLQNGVNAGIPSSSIQDGFRTGNNFYTDMSGINMNGYDFMMTLYSGGDLVAWTKWLYNDNLDTAGHVTAASIQQTGTGFGTVSGNDLTGGPGITVTPYGFGKDVVPEPTGGLLMLVGGALLALRRKRSV